MLNKHVKVSSNHIREAVKKLEQSNLVEVIPTAKIKRIRITDRGKRAADLILQLRSILRGTDLKWQSTMKSLNENSPLREF